MGDADVSYEAELPDLDWDGVIRAHELGRMVRPDGGIRLSLPRDSADDLVRILKQRDRVRVIPVEVPRAPTAFDAVLWGVALYAACDLARAYLSGWLA